MIKRDNASYYEKSDFSSLIKKQNGKRVGYAAKRITLNISDKIYDEANQLDTYMKMGYQNVLKTAMTIGLTKLFTHLSQHKITKRNKSRWSSLQTRKKIAGPRMASSPRT